MKVITCITDEENYGYKTFLSASCNYFNLDLVTLLHEGEWTTHRLKDFYLGRYLKTLPSSEIILFTDGYDTMLLCNEDEIVQKYRDFSMPIVFAAEKNCWPCMSLAEKYPHSDSAFKYLNSGGFIGKSETILYLLNKYTTSFFIDSDLCNVLDTPYRWSNQFCWTRIFLENQNLISLDYDNNLFLELSTEFWKLFPNGIERGISLQRKQLNETEQERLDSELILDRERVIVAKNKSTPSHIHFNGPIVKQIAFNNYFEPVMPWLRNNTYNLFTP